MLQKPKRFEKYEFSSVARIM